MSKQNIGYIRQPNQNKILDLEEKYRENMNFFSSS